ncbi:MAG: arginine--tRNA ligase [Yaniella sp.]|uniref:arginine--tRNA ligase n=2 Tax=Yaniella sp. TaxID=2773929 RepID=UPI002648D387|nr:arginine--tRNA ligase [Yaniella sp.]MDN5731348.1 arginine--tRNA ligase [Yaniella sp.]MDN5817358.1 arginine--tRNA ligase [Yaniella sp.]MDN5837759.1 arginine--tRNA ligase [Yaniella sp.]MDN6147910.1 arginine--tRNA ligase [Yaniella sp.]MDN6357941.1 arginine--tRNA ligase [Yaniella sp.]
MNPEKLSEAIAHTLHSAIEAGEIDLPADAVPEAPRVDRPKSRDHGDWATNIAMQLGKRAGMNPRQFAEILAPKLQALDGVAKVEVAGPGFINIVLDAAAAGELARTIVEAGDVFGHNDQAAGDIVNVEFVSANPTGPLHIGHTRWAALGDAIGRLLRASGAKVTNEYYINDYGAQLDVFASSVWSRMHGEEVPEGGYPGQYIFEIADAILAEDPDIKDQPFEEVLPRLRTRAYELQLDEIKHTLNAFQVHFDVWFSEAELHANGAVEDALERLKAQGHTFEEEGAFWLRTTDFGDDKDRVLIKADDKPTYFAGDAAYYLSKKDRGFDQKIYLLGADHHGYVNRLRALAACAGDDMDVNIEILIGQLISVDGAKLSKRAGNIIELKDLIEWLGVDALRYSLARYPNDSPIEIDPELLRAQTNDNPVFYVQYAHARSCSAARTADAQGVVRDPATFDASALNHPTEEELLSKLAQFPSIVGSAAKLRQPHRLARHLESIAAAYHAWYAAARIVPAPEHDGAKPEPQTVNYSRRWLNDATTQVLANGLGLLGVSAPEKM